MIRTAAAAALAVTFGYMPYHIYARSGFARYLHLKAELADMQQQNATLKAQIQRLAREAVALRDDPRAVEQVARQELGWVQPGDVVVDLREVQR